MPKPKRKTCRFVIVHLTARRSVCCYKLPPWAKKEVCADHVIDKVCNSCRCHEPKEGKDDL